MSYAPPPPLAPPPRPRPLIVDAHEDIAFNVLGANRDHRRSARETRALEAGNDEVRRHMGLATLGLAEWLEGRVAVIFATIFVEPARSTFASDFSATYTTPDEAHVIGQRQLDVYRSLTAGGGPFRLVRDAAELDRVLATWTGSAVSPSAAGATEAPGVSPATGDGDAGREIGLVLLMENADAIREPDELDAWYEAGLRLVGPAWMGTRYCGGTSEPGPLTDLGRQLLARMAARRMVLDTSHMAEEAFFDAVERYPGPLMASHSNPRRFVEGDRHLSDAMICALIGRDGVVGHVPFNAFLVPGWRRSAGGRKDAADLATIVRAIEHICDLAGNARHVGFGSDLDGGFGAEATPVGIDTVADLQRVADALSDRGFTDGDVAGIAHGNWLRVLRSSLPAKS